MNDDDEAIITQLHHEFVEANTREDVVWLQAHTTLDVSWFNLNKSNYFTQDHILALWRELYRQRPDKNKTATLTVSDRHVEAVGDIAWVAYNMSVDYDFGDFAQYHAGARSTEIWRRTMDGWKLSHLHCSEHQPGNMGGQ